MKDLFGGWAISIIVWVGQVAGQGQVSWEPITIAGVAGILLFWVLRTFERLQSDQKSDRDRLIEVVSKNTESNVRMEAKMEDVLRALMKDERTHHI
jgi:hypothetical protein